jgi:hypothetical protein
MTPEEETQIEERVNQGRRLRNKIADFQNMLEAIEHKDCEYIVIRVPTFMADDKMTPAIALHTQGPLERKTITRSLCGAPYQDLQTELLIAVQTVLQDKLEALKEKYKAL